ncbi:MAG: hypothetical protein GF353_22880 [Candidatus Lokiarchaeota archaeon]|nr:hypothetical protein [Candidatus Lokiarchaeota archaeon]
MSVPDSIKLQAKNLIKHEKTFKLSELGTQRITVFVPQRFNINKEYWEQFLPEKPLNAGAVEKKEREYRYVGKEIVHISYDRETQMEERRDLRNLSACPHEVCNFCHQIKKMESKFENGIYRLIKIRDFFTFSANTNLIQATIWVEKGKAQIHSYTGNSEFMKSDVVNKHRVACVWTNGRKEHRSIKVYAIEGEGDNNYARVWCHISRYNVANWP